jgi:ABC-type branched-subunit amino acid transport system ATPase component
MSTNIIKIKALNKWYGKFHALKNINLAIDKISNKPMINSKVVSLNNAINEPTILGIDIFSA